MLASHPLIAQQDGGWLQFIVPLILFILYGIGQLMANRNAGNPQQAPRRRPKVEGGPKGDKAPRQEPAPLEDSLRNEVEDFIRRVQGKDPEPEKRPAVAREMADRPRPERQQPQRQKIPDRPRWAEPRPAERHVPRQTQSPPKIDEALPEVVLVDDTPGEFRSLSQRGGAEGRRQFSGGKHPEGTLSSRNPPQRSQFVGQVALTDTHLQSQVEQLPQYRLGSLGHREELVVKATNTLAADVVQMLRTPEGMKQLVIAGEILRRPEI